MRWFYAGPIECPSCHSPISDGTAICPYCHSAAPLSAPWQQIRWQATVLVLVGVAALWLGDTLFGSRWLAWLGMLCSQSR